MAGRIMACSTDLFSKVVYRWLCHESRSRNCSCQGRVHEKRLGLHCDGLCISVRNGIVFLIHEHGCLKSIVRLIIKNYADLLHDLARHNLGMWHLLFVPLLLARE